MQSLDLWWLAVGFFSQVFFAARFVVQWIASELKKTSHLPPAFWYLSVAGSLGLLVYSVHRKDPVFIVGQAVALLIYLRNIMLIKGTK